MLIKAGPVRSTREAESLRGAHVLGVVPGDVEWIRDATSARICVRIDDLDDAADLVAEHDPDFVEFVAADPEKVDLVSRQLSALRSLGVPAIARGFYVSVDDTSLLDQRDHLRAFAEAGVRYFEVELDSLVDPDFSISRRVRARLGELFDRFDVLVTDSFSGQLAALGVGECGVYLDLGDDRGRPQRFKVSSAARLIRSA